MPGLGTIINCVAIVAGGLIGVLLGGRMGDRMQESLLRANGICVVFIGAAGALSGMLSVTADAAATSGYALASGRSLLVIGSMVLGVLLGELADLDALIRRFGEWLKARFGGEGDRTFVEGFVTASMTVSVGAMAVVGALQDGMAGDISVLVTKAILDFIIVMAMACSLGRGCLFSAIPVAVFQGSVTALAVVLAPVMTQAALGNVSLVGGILIFCVGVNLVWKSELRVLNMLPALILAPAMAFLPLGL